MISCPVGAVVRKEELAVIEQSAKSAVEWLDCIIRSETPPRSIRNDQDRKLLCERQRQLAQFKRLLKMVDKINRAHERKAAKAAA
jgi:hypothetical protein